MNIIFDRPPLFDEIDAAFHVAGKAVIFAWGDTIYNPERIDVPPQLVAHEAVHGARQACVGIEWWWREYIADPAFRLQEEIPAHRAEYDHLVTRARNRNHRRYLLKATAKRLAAPLYGPMVTPRRAAELLKRAGSGG